MSILFLFSNAFVVIGGLLFDSLGQPAIEQSDLLENETENESESKVPTPEEEEEHAPFSMHLFYDLKEKAFSYAYHLFHWDNVSPTVPTEPPEEVV
jgi:hypothetical protein